MGKLEELEEELYGKDPGIATGRSKRQAVFSSPGRALRTSWEEVRPRPGPLSRLRFSKATAIAAFAVLLFVAGAGAFTYIYLGTERREARVEIGGRDSIEAGELMVIPVMVRNISSEPLEEADLTVTFPQDTFLQDESGRLAPVSSRLVRRVGTLEPGEEKSAEFVVQFFGREGEEKKIRASLAYRPSGLRARFSSEAERKAKVVYVPLAIYWDIPETVSAGQEVSITIRVSSQARSSFDDLWLRVDYPSGFTVSKAAPAASGPDALWRVGTLAPGEERSITLTGVFASAAGDAQTLHAGLGRYQELTKEWKPWQESVREVALSASPFFLEGSIENMREGIIQPGASLSLAVRYRNRSAVPVKNITVRAALEGAAIDFSTLVIGDGGVLDAPSRTIVWGPGGTAMLREVLPGQEGVVHISARVRPRPVMQSAADKNLTIRLTAHIETVSIPQELAGSALSPDDTVAFKVATVALISGRSVHRTSPIPNSGPLPPKVGEKTTYTVVWEARNFTNEIEGTEMRASLPPNVRWENIVSPRDADVRFDAASGEVRWRLGMVAPGTGVLTPGRIAAFQVSLIPSEIDLGRSPALTGTAHFSGRDAFTGADIALEMEGLSTQMPEDPLVKGAEWTVAR